MKLLVNILMLLWSALLAMIFCVLVCSVILVAAYLLTTYASPLLILAIVPAGITIALYKSYDHLDHYEWETWIEDTTEVIRQFFTRSRKQKGSDTLGRSD